MQIVAAPQTVARIALPHAGICRSLGKVMRGIDSLAARAFEQPEPDRRDRAGRTRLGMPNR
ncbi:hypothetical protein GCM10025771_15550 [Niveibacterium umoris]